MIDEFVVPMMGIWSSGRLLYSSYILSEERTLLLVFGISQQKKREILNLPVQLQCLINVRLLELPGLHAQSDTWITCWRSQPSGVGPFPYPVILLQKLPCIKFFSFFLSFIGQSYRALIELSIFWPFLFLQETSYFYIIIIIDEYFYVVNFLMIILI